MTPLLAQPLECQDRPSLMAFGTRDRPGRLKISPRDFCRFGLLYLRGGAWRGRQIVSADHVQLAVVGGNVPAAKLYERLGFSPFGELRTVLFL